MGPSGNDQSPAAQAGTNTGSTSRKPKFLVVEDDPQMRALIAYALRRDGAEVVETGHGVDLLEWAELATWTSKRDVFDGIFSDIRLPDLTALDVLSKVPSIHRITPVILVTAFGDEETRQKAYALGAEMVLNKPVHPGDLRALARSLAGRRAAQRGVGAATGPDTQREMPMILNAREHRAATPATEPGRPHVLLVEDDADHRRLIAWMLRAEGCEVVEAETGIELLEWIGAATSSPRRDSFDAIVSDVNMPDLTAIDVLSGWRYGAWPVPLILVSASDDPTMRFEAHALGASAVLTKPVRASDLRQALERALARRRPSDGPLDPRA